MPASILVVGKAMIPKEQACMQCGVYSVSRGQPGAELGPCVVATMGRKAEEEGTENDGTHRWNHRTVSKQTAERPQRLLSQAATFETSVITSSVYKRVNRGTEKTTSLKTHSHGEPHWVDTQSCPMGQEQGLVSRSFRDRFHT